MDRQPCGPPGRGSNPDLAAAARLWVDATCARQGLAVKIADPTVLATVGALLERGEAEETPVAPRRHAGGQARQTGVTRVGSKRLRPR